jgi:hypothetical protein
MYYQGPVYGCQPVQHCASLLPIACQLKVENALRRGRRRKRVAPKLPPNADR